MTSISDKILFDRTQKRTRGRRNQGRLRRTAWPSCCSCWWSAAASSRTPSAWCSTGALLHEQLLSRGLSYN